MPLREDQHDNHQIRCLVLSLCTWFESVYGSNHSVVVYKTDLKTWENKGVALSPHARRSGTGTERNQFLEIATEMN